MLPIQSGGTILFLFLADGKATPNSSSSSLVVFGIVLIVRSESPMEPSGLWWLSKSSVSKLFYLEDSYSSSLLSLLLSLSGLWDLFASSTPYLMRISASSCKWPSDSNRSFRVATFYSNSTLSAERALSWSSIWELDAAVSALSLMMDLSLCGTGTFTFCLWELD